MQLAAVHVEPLGQRVELPPQAVEGLEGGGGGPQLAGEHLQCVGESAGGTHVLARTTGHAHSRDTWGHARRSVRSRERAGSRRHAEAAVCRPDSRTYRAASTSQARFGVCVCVCVGVCVCVCVCVCVRACLGVLVERGERVRRPPDPEGLQREGIRGGEERLQRRPEGLQRVKLDPLGAAVPLVHIRLAVPRADLWACRGRVVDVSWTCRGRVVDVSRRATG